MVTQAVEDTGQVVQWVEPGALEGVPVSKNSIYVLDTFDVPIFVRLSGKTRYNYIYIFNI